MSSEVLHWQEEVGLDDRRRLRNGAIVSLALHALVAAVLVFSPPGSAPPMPDVLSVDLIGGVPAPAPSPSAPAVPRSAPPPAAEPAPAPEPAPPPAEPPPPPAPKAPVQVLPEESAEKVKQAEPEPKPKVVQKPEPKAAPPKPEPVRRARGAKHEQLGMDDLLAELGEDEVSGALQARPDPAQAAAAAQTAESSGEPGARSGEVVSKALAAWSNATTRRIQSKWVTPANLRGRGLATSLELRLSATGEVLGSPRVVRSSGDPFFDDNAVRAVLMVNPLPPPPRAGKTVFVFRSEGD